MKKAMIVLLVFVATLAGLVTLVQWIDHAEQHSAQFDPQAWAKNESRSPRVRMAGDLVRQLKAGKHDRDTVRELLGKPTYGGESDPDWGYQLGMTTFGLYDLIIRFDEQGHVADVTIYRL